MGFVANFRLRQTLHLARAIIADRIKAIEQQGIPPRIDTMEHRITKHDHERCIRCAARIDAALKGEP